MLINKIIDLRKELDHFSKQGKKIAIVPTMGGLHDGHIGLVKKAGEVADIVVVTIFINPAQFNSKLDYSRYYRNLESDLKKLSDHKVDYVFSPSNEEIYPQGFNTQVTINAYNDCLCAKYRPGHFEGVALVVTKLFNIVKPSHAIFGEKDFQQLKIIQKLVQDLNYDIKIISVPTIRNSEGLVLSSRNNNLSKEGLELAKKIYLSLKLIKDQINQDCQNISHIINIQKKNLVDLGIEVEYLEVRSEYDFKLPENSELKGCFRVFIAAIINQVRLIDNINI